MAGRDEEIGREGKEGGKEGRREGGRTRTYLIQARDVHVD